MIKLLRQKKIIDIIRLKSIETQEELVNELGLAGFTSTQATVSRDIKDLGLVKITGEYNRSFYAMPDGASVPVKENRIKRLFINSVQLIDSSENLIVIKTSPGEAPGVALAIDQVGWPGIIGTVAGDDTILIVVKPTSAADNLLKQFKQLTGG